MGRNNWRSGEGIPGRNSCCCKSVMLVITWIWSSRQVHLRSSTRETWLAQVRADDENLRAALSWSLTPQGDLAVGMRIAGVLYWFWLHEGTWSEGRTWLEKLLAQAPRHVESVSLARAVHGLSVLVWVQGERLLSEQLAREAVALAPRSGDAARVARGLSLLVRA